MNLGIVNRYTESAQGGGLPWYNRKAFQHRFRKGGQGNFLGYWATPAQTFPTFQFSALGKLADVISFEMVKVAGLSDIQTSNLNKNLLYEICVAGQATSFIYSKEDALPYQNGFYYFRLDFSGKSLYSEVFHLGGVACMPAPYSLDLTSSSEFDLHCYFGSPSEYKTVFYTEFGFIRPTFDITQEFVEDELKNKNLVFQSNTEKYAFDILAILPLLPTLAVVGFHNQVVLKNLNEATTYNLQNVLYSDNGSASDILETIRLTGEMQPVSVTTCGNEYTIESC